MRRDAEKTKDPVKQEEKETERLVRKAPEKKPPRQDRSRNRIKQDDPDLESDKKDLSLNYKDVGGSVLAAIRIARLFLAAKPKTPLVIVPPDDHADTYRVLDEKGNTQSFRKKKDAERWLENKKRELLEKKEDRRQESLRNQSVEDRVRKELERKEQREQDRKDRDERRSPSSQLPQGSDNTRERAVNESLNSAQKTRISQVQGALSTLPPSFDEKSAFASGASLTPKAQESLQKHYGGMGPTQLLGALGDLRDQLEEARLEGSAEAEQKAQALLAVAEEAEQRLKSSPPLTDAASVTSALGGDADPNAPATEAFHREMQGKMSAFALQVRNTSPGDRAELVASLRQERPSKGSVASAIVDQALRTLNTVIAQDAFQSDSMTDLLLQKLSDSKVREESGVEVDSKKLQDPEGTRALVGDLESMEDHQLAKLVADNPFYRMAGGVPKNPDESFTFSPDRKAAMLELVRGNLETRAFFNDLDMRAPTQARINHLLTGAKTEGENAKIKKALSKYSTGSDSDVAQGIVNLLTRGTAMKNKNASYRGLPGPLDPSDSYAPLRPEWRLPDALDLSPRDYAQILYAAVEWLMSPSCAPYLSMERDAMERHALDQAIYSYSDGKYQSKIDARTYNVLLRLLTQVTAEEIP